METAVLPVQDGRKRGRWSAEKKELKAEIRNKLSLPLIVLEHLHDGKQVSSKNLKLAINDLKAVIRKIDKEC